MPVHHLLEQILNEYIVAAGLQSGQPLFQSVNSLGTAVTGRALTATTPGPRFEAGEGGGFSHPRRMSHLAGNRHHDLPGERRTARTRPADGGT